MPSNDKERIRRLMLLFALVYTSEGIGGGLVAQPLNYYLKQVAGWTPLQITSGVALLSIPWLIKPLFGIVSDTVVLFGYRRKSYLALTNIVAAIACFATLLIAGAGSLLFLLALLGYALAAASAVAGALLVENGQRFSVSERFVNQQWIWYNVANVASAIIAGAILDHFTPATGLNIVVAAVGVFPLGIAVFGARLFEEPKSANSVGRLGHSFSAVMSVFKSRMIWLIAIFIFLYDFSPGFGLPLYYHMTDDLKFSQGFIGALGSISSAGSIVAGIIYDRFLGKLPSARMLYVGIAVGIFANLSYLTLHDPATAIVVNLIDGFSFMLLYVSALTLAADFCPKEAEGFFYAIMMSIISFADIASDNAGSYLYEHVFHSTLRPLIFTSAAFTALSLVLIPLLRLGRKRQGEAVLAATDSSRT